MLQIRKKYKGMRWNTIYFAQDRMKKMEKRADILEYNHLLAGRREILPAFPKLQESRETITLVTNLKEPEDSLFQKIEKNGRYEIRRSEREGTQVSCYDSKASCGTWERLIRFYNDFVDTKEGLDFKLSYEWIKPFLVKQAFWCTTAEKDGEILAVHMYYGDGTRIRLWYSASLFREKNDKQKKNEIGRANRLLHWKDIIYFKNEGFSYYDWGGYSMQGETAGIGGFKKSFGGTVEKGMTVLTYGSIIGRIGLMYRKVIYHAANISNR